MATAFALRLACAVEQIEQAWCDDDESSGCACTAWAMPIAHTSAIARRQTVLTQALRFVDALTTIRKCWDSTRCLWTILPLDGHPGIHDAGR